MAATDGMALDEMTAPPAADTPDFVLDLLRELRADGYRPSAWGRFFARSWHVSRRTACEHPRLVASWKWTALALALGDAASLLAAAHADGDEAWITAARALPGTTVCLAYTLGDAYVHLAMNQPDRAAPLYETLGVPTALTLARGAASSLLLGHLLGGRPASRELAAAALGVALATDLADGALAHAQHRTTRLGAYLDGEADFGFGLALGLTLLARGWLPRWLAVLLLARWTAPLGYALTRYFGGIARVEMGSTPVGKAAGLAQAATIGVALLPERVSGRFPRLRRALHLATAALLIAAPLSQLARALGGPRVARR